jgi:hypothetical protein
MNGVQIDNTAGESKQENAIRLAAGALIRQAAAEGFNLTIERRSLQPPAMGHTEFVVTVWEARK